MNDNDVNADLSDQEPPAHPLLPPGRRVPALLKLALTRSSVAPKTLVHPGPLPEEMRVLVLAALTAPDHQGLRPWRFISIEGPGRHALSRTFMQIRKLRDPDVRPEELNRTWRKTMRAPTLVAVVARLVHDHPKVPTHEQYMSIGAAVHAMLLACHAFGYGAIVLSGSRARHPLIRELLQIRESEDVVGFISIGTPSKPIPPKQRPNPEEFLEVWSGDPVPCTVERQAHARSNETEALTANGACPHTLSQ